MVEEKEIVIDEENKDVEETPEEKELRRVGKNRNKKREK